MDNFIQTPMRPFVAQISELNNKNDIFERTIILPDAENKWRSCRSMFVPVNYEPIPGKYCILGTTGSGYSQWYHYMSLQGQHYLMFETFHNDEHMFTWRHVDGVPESFGVNTEVNNDHIWWATSIEPLSMLSFDDNVERTMND